MRTAEDIVRNKTTDALGVDVGATIKDALELMQDKRIGSVVVREGDKLVGIWTERDLIRNALVEGFDPAAAKIADYMTRDLDFVSHELTIFELMDYCLGVRHRRILVQKDGEFLGLLTAGDVMRACLREKDEEFKEVNALASWQYYEDWGMVTKPKPKLEG